MYTLITNNVKKLYKTYFEKSIRSFLIYSICKKLHETK